MITCVFGNGYYQLQVELLQRMFQLNVHEFSKYIIQSIICKTNNNRNITSHVKYNSVSQIENVFQFLLFHNCLHHKLHSNYNGRAAEL